MRQLKSTTLGLAACALAATTASSARADIVTALSGRPTAAGNGYYAYTYNVELSGGQLDLTNGSTTNPLPAEFGTVYDFGTMEMSGGTPLISETGLLASSFVFSFGNTSTPFASQTAPTDNPLLANVRFTYDGTQNYVVTGETTTLTTFSSLPLSATNLGTFTIYSPLSTFSTTTNSFDGQSYKGGNNTVEGNVGFVGAPASVPEPASLAVLGVATAGALTSRRRRR